ncbi:MAG: DNA-binding protein [Planctomycetota bacterium]|nr:MAG: DNA-binding protein [Planctomycetota bacterium]
MAKMFYTLEEAAEKLGKAPEDVRQMAQSGQIQEFRDRDRLMFKVDQIDLLALGDDERHDERDMSSMIPLAADDEGDSLGGLDLGSGLNLDEDASGAMSIEDSAAGSGPAPVGAESASALDLEPIEADAKERTGVSIFDADELEAADPSAVTQLSEGGFGEGPLDSLGSGSGLLDLTRESDDTSLGAEFLDELASADDATTDRDVPTGGLFETTGEELAAGAGEPAAVVAVAEPIDAGGSGLTAGLSIGAVLALAIGLFTVIIGLMDVPDAGNVMQLLADNFIMVVGGLAGLAFILGVIGFALGKRAG